MTTIKVTKPESAAGDPPSSTPPKQSARPLVPPRAPSSAKFKNKVILSTLDGKIEWDKMTTEARKAFEELFADKNFLKQFGVVKGDQAFKPEEMKQLYDGLSFVYQAIASMLLRWPPAITKLLAYDDDEKEMLAEPTANLINRFAPKLLSDNKEILLWAMVFGAVTNAKFQKAREEMAKLDARNKTAQPGAAPARGTEVKPAQPGPTRIPAVAWPDNGNGAVV